MIISTPLLVQAYSQQTKEGNSASGESSHPPWSPAYSTLKQTLYKVNILHKEETCFLTFSLLQLVLHCCDKSEFYNFPNPLLIPVPLCLLILSAHCQPDAAWLERKYEAAPQADGEHAEGPLRQGTPRGPDQEGRLRSLLEG